MNIAIPWYETDDDFKAILELAPFDESKLFKPHGQWIKNVEIQEQKLQAEGHRTYRVKITAAAIKTWVESRDAIVCREEITNYAIAQMSLFWFKGSWLVIGPLPAQVSIRMKPTEWRKLYLAIEKILESLPPIALPRQSFDSDTQKLHALLLKSQSHAHKSLARALNVGRK